MSSLESTTPQAGWWPLFCFPEGGTTAQVCSFPLANGPWLACLLCLLPVYQSSGPCLRECSQEASHRVKGGVVWHMALCGHILLSWSVPSPQLWSPHNKVLNAVTRKGVSSAASHTAGEARCSLTGFLFPLQEKPWAVPSQGWYDAGKVKLFLLPTPMHSNLFYSSGMLFFSSGNLNFHKGSLVLRWFPKLVFCRHSHTAAKRS